MFEAKELQHGACALRLRSVSGIYVAPYLTRLSCVVFLLLVGIFLSASADAAEIRSHAAVMDDGTLVIRRHQIRLYGIHIPLTDSTCKRFISPVRRCAPRAVLELDFKIDGFAMVLPDATYEYKALERIARSRQIGVWGTPVDFIRRR